jgi:YD repeat-containing protein
MTDDAIPFGSSLMGTWTKVSGPSTVTFANPNATSTNAAFSAGGTYVLRLMASDSQLSASDDVLVNVSATNQPPTVNAGANQAILQTDNANLNGTVSDDGLLVGSSVSSSWSVLSGTGTVTFGSPNVTVTTASFSEAGTYVLQLNATDSALSGSDEITITVEPAQPVPTVEIISPESGTNIVSPAFVVGSVSGGAWKLESALSTDDGGNNQAWTTFATGNGAVTNARLGTIDPTMMLNCIYTVRLSAMDSYGQISLTSISVVVDKGLKVGNFTISYTDLSIPVAGLPMSVIRSYDSRDKRKGDFGVGWTLGINSIRVEKSRVLGSGWAETATITVIPNYCIQATKPHIVTITFPDGKVYKFEAETEQQCQRAAPITSTSLVFRPMAGTHGSLAAEGQTDVLVAGSIPGPVDLISYSDPDLFNASLFRLTTEDGTVYLIDQKTGVKTVTDTNNNVLTVSPNGITHSSGKSIAFTRDAGGRIETITDKLGHTTRFEYDGNGNVLRKVDAKGGTTSYTYDASDNVLTETNALGKTTTYTYDSQGNRTSITDALGNTTAYTYNGLQQVLTITDALGHVTTNTYNAAGNTLSTKDARGNTTSYSYDANGNRASQSVKRLNAAGVSETLTTSYQFDSLNRLLKTTNPDGSTSQVEYNSIERQRASVDQLGRRTTFDYDELGRLIRTNYPDGTKEETTYDAAGQRIRSKDHAGRETLNTYDELGRLVKTTYPDATSTATTYDAIGQATSTTDARGNVTRYEFDALGRRTKVTDALNHVTTFAYDAAGNQISVLDARNNLTTYEYDRNNRRTKTKYADGTTSLVTYNSLGRVTARTDQAGKTTQFEYDALGRLLKVTDALSQVTRYDYNEVGQNVAQTDANNHTTRFEYDKLGRRTKRTLPGGQTEAYAYRAQQPTSMTVTAIVWRRVWRA